MANFSGLNAGGHSGYHQLRQQADQWPTTRNTPDGPAGMLRASRDLYTLGYYAYDLLAVGVTWCIFAVEAALRIYLRESRKVRFTDLVKKAEQRGILPRPGWDNQRLDAGREYRNRAVHGNNFGVLPPAMARNAIAASHEAVAAVFPDDPVEIDNRPARK